MSFFRSRLAQLCLGAPSIWCSASSRPGHRWLLIRRTPRTGELAFYRCYAPLAALVKVAGRRWTVEENFRPARA
jgi:hypothetical protein